MKKYCCCYYLDFMSFLLLSLFSRVTVLDCKRSGTESISVLYQCFIIQCNNFYIVRKLPSQLSINNLKLHIYFIQWTSLYCIQKKKIVSILQKFLLTLFSKAMYIAAFCSFSTATAVSIFIHNALDSEVCHGSDHYTLGKIFKQFSATFLAYDLIFAAASKLFWFLTTEISVFLSSFTLQLFSIKPEHYSRTKNRYECQGKPPEMFRPAISITERLEKI